MLITKVKVENYKCLRDTEVNLSNFTTLIGHNNSGKSALMQAISFIRRRGRSSMPPAVYFDQSRDIVIEATFEGILDDDLGTLTPEHEARMKEIISDGTLILVRRFPPNGPSSLKCKRLLPTDERFSVENVDKLLTGVNGKANITKVVESKFSELRGEVDVTTQAAAKELINQLGDKYPKELQEAFLPVGIEQGMTDMLPEPLYIAAVNDLADDIKTTESAPLGKILSILRPLIQSQLTDFESMLAVLNEKLNPTKKNGQAVDNRVPAIKEIESLIGNYVSENFPDVQIKLQIPPPELGDILSSTNILADDGVEGDIETKGDGLKRAVTFAILRTVAELTSRPSPGDSAQKFKQSYIFLFEEPELYLHPTSQRILFDSLRVIAQNQQVIVSTHSPLFLTEGVDGRFIKMSKVRARGNGVAPSSEVIEIDLSDLSSKDQFQIICYDNNNAAFFADTVILVEGPSDHICLSHIPPILNPKWIFSENNIMIVKVNGKGSFAKYRQFFDRFDVRVCIVADLDVVIRDFDKLGLPSDVTKMRSALIQEIDQLAEEEARIAELNGEEISEVIRSLSNRGKWARSKKIIEGLTDGQEISDEERGVLFSLFDREKDIVREKILRGSGPILKKKRDLFARARNNDVYILEKGSIEAYYPDTVEGQDKPSKAQKFCSVINTADQVKELCDQIPIEGESDAIPEFDLIFRGIFPESE